MPAAVLRKITVQGFKSIAALELEPKPINIIIGANGSGKSNFLDVFQLLREATAGRLKDYVGAAGGAEKILHFGRKTTERIAIRLELNSASPIGNSGYEIALKPTANDGLFPSEASDELIYPKYSDRPQSLQEWQEPGEAGMGNDDREVEAYTKGLRQQFDWWRVYHFADVGPLRSMSPSHDNRLFLLSPDGRNLAGFLYRLLTNGFVDSYRQIVKAIPLLSGT